MGGVPTALQDGDAAAGVQCGPMTSDRSTDAAIDTLYEAPLDQFVARRNALATELRKAGDRAGADVVKALAKPSLVAWAVNQAWWREPEAVQRVLDAAAAQRDAHGAGMTEVRTAAEARAVAVKAVLDLAVTALGGGAAVTPDTRHRLVGTIEALAAGGWPDGVSPGRLTRELQPSGLEAFGLLSTAGGAMTSAAPPLPRPTLVRGRAAPPAPEAGAGTRRDTAARKAEGTTSTTRPVTTGGPSPPTTADLRRHAREKQREAARARLTALESALEAAAREAAARAADEQQARAAADAAAARLVELERALEQAREAARAARRAASAATAALGEAELTRARTARDVAHARAAIEALEDG